MTADPTRQLAEELVRRGLGAPARLLADAHRPAAPLLSDLGAALAPLLAASGIRGVADVGDLLEDPDGLDRLVSELDAAGGRRGESS